MKWTKHILPFHVMAGSIVLNLTVSLPFTNSTCTWHPQTSSRIPDWLGHIVNPESNLLPKETVPSNGPKRWQMWKRAEQMGVKKSKDFFPEGLSFRGYFQLLKTSLPVPRHSLHTEFQLSPWLSISSLPARWIFWYLFLTDNVLEIWKCKGMERREREREGGENMKTHVTTVRDSDIGAGLVYWPGKDRTRALPRSPLANEPFHI